MAYGFRTFSINCRSFFQYIRIYFFFAVYVFIGLHDKSFGHFFPALGGKNYCKYSLVLAGFVRSLENFEWFRRVDFFELRNFVENNLGFAINKSGVIEFYFFTWEIKP